MGFGIEICDVLHQMFIHLNKKRLEDQNRGDCGTSSVEKFPALNVFHSILTGLYFCKKKNKQKKHKTKTKNKHGEDISTNSNAILEYGKEWQPAAFSATQRARQRECVWIRFIHTPKEWSFLHPLSCNPYCSLQHYQMKESPIAFEKKKKKVFIFECLI